MEQSGCESLFHGTHTVWIFFPRNVSYSLIMVFISKLVPLSNPCSANARKMNIYLYLNLGLFCTLATVAGLSKISLQTFYYVRALMWVLSVN